MRFLSRSFKSQHVVPLLPSSMVLFQSQGETTPSAQGSNKDEMEQRSNQVIMCMQTISWL